MAAAMKRLTPGTGIQCLALEEAPGAEVPHPALRAGLSRHGARNSGQRRTLPSCHPLFICNSFGDAMNILFRVPHPSS
jgi:hypothetical protein